MTLIITLLLMHHMGILTLWTGICAAGIWWIRNLIKSVSN